jgi:hypothetical protein
MYNIDLKVDKPDIRYMKDEVEKMMGRGIKLADCREAMGKYIKLRDGLKELMWEKYRIENPNSSVQVIAYIKDLSSKVDLKNRNEIIEVCYDSVSRKWTSNGDALAVLSELGYEFAETMLDYRKAKKYAESIKSLMDASGDGNVIHPSVSIAKTNRINYSKPALLNIPKELLWDLVVPYKDGNALYSIDIKNQEPNILINMTGANSLKPALEAEEGLYEYIFKICFKPIVIANILIDMLPENRVYSTAEVKRIGTISPAYYSAVKPMTRDTYYNGKRVVMIETVCAGGEKGVVPELPKVVNIETEDGNIHEVTVVWRKEDKLGRKQNDYQITGDIEGLEVIVGKAERDEFKTAWNAISYGGSIMLVKESCKLIDGAQIYRYMNKIEELKNYWSMVGKLAKSGTTSINIIFGTRLDAGDETGNRLKRVLSDLPIQGSAADILSLLIMRFHSYCEEKGLNNKLMLYYTRHDEVIVEVNSLYLESVGDSEVKEILKDMFEHRINDWTPFKVEIKRVV